MNKVHSSDGTAITFDRLGDGPPVVLVCGASTDRMANAPLAKLLAERFIVFNYDRRGRGDSNDTPPYAVEREVEDIGAVIDVAGGSAFVYGTSSFGGVLALEAAIISPSGSWRCGSRRSSSARVADRQQTLRSATTRRSRLVGEAQQAFSRAAQILKDLAARIKDEGLREGFLAAPRVLRVLEHH